MEAAFAVPLPASRHRLASGAPVYVCMPLADADRLLRRSPDQRLPRAIQHQLDRRFALGRQLRVAKRLEPASFTFSSCRCEAIESPPARSEGKWERQIREEGDAFYAKAKQTYLKDTLACGAVFFALSFSSQYPEEVTYSFLCGVGLAVGYVLLLIRSVDRLGKDNFQLWTLGRLAVLAAGLIAVDAAGLDFWVAFLGFQTHKAAALLDLFRTFVALEFDKPNKP
eukprot:tig00000404_g401.t1